MEIRKVLDWFDLAETRLNIGRDWMFDFWNSKCEERGTCSRSELQSAKESHFCTFNFNLNKPATQIKRKYHVIRPEKDGTRWYNFDRLFQIDKCYVGSSNLLVNPPILSNQFSQLLAWSTGQSLMYLRLRKVLNGKIWFPKHRCSHQLNFRFLCFQWHHENFWKLQKLENMVILKSYW